MSAVGPAGRFRLILEVRPGDPALNLALEEAIFSSLDAGGPRPTLRLWVCRPSVVLGVNQDPATYVDMDFCEAMGIGVNRRITGGGTIYMDEGNLNWSFYVPQGPRDPDPSSLYQAYGGLVARALRRMGYDVGLAPPNRIDHRGRKISGMAAYIKRDRILIHGTLLVNADLSALHRAIRRHTSPVPVANLVGGMDAGEFAPRLVEALHSTGLRLEGSELTREEETRARMLLNTKYRLLSWVLEGAPRVKP